MSIDRMQTFFRASRIGLPGVCLLMLWVGVTSAAPAGAPQEAVDALAGEERFDEAIALCREVVRDAKAPVSQRWALGRKAAEWLRRRQEKPDEAEKILERLLQLPLEPVQRAAVQRDLIYSAIHLIKPRDLDTVETRALALIEDSEAPAYLRGHAAIDLLNCFRAERNHEQKARPLPTIEKLLASDVLSARDEVRLRETLQRTLRDLGRAEAVLEQARIVVANTNAPAVQRVTACAELAEPLIERGDDAAAEELLRRSFAFPGLDAQGVARIVERIGRLYLLRDRMDEALEVYREAYRFFKTPEMTNRVVGLCAATLTDELRFEEAAGLWLAQGNRLEAAGVYGSRHSPLVDKARELYRQVLEDSSRPLAERARAYRAFLTFDPRDIPLAVKYRDVFVEADPARAAATFEQLITARGRGTAYFGDFEGTLRYLEWLRPLAEPNFNYRTTLFGIHALAALGRLDEATDLAREAVDYAGFAPPETYQMQMIRAALAIRDPATTVEQAAARLAAEDAAATRDRPLTSEQRAEALAFVGTTALHANLEPVVRALDALRRGLYVPEPTKRYTVTYSPRPITGIDSWDRFAPRTERQVLDRGYGGNMEFLATDVSTGDRGAGIRSGTGDDTRRFTELSLVCDVNGIHIRLDAFDERAREIGAKLLGGGSYEGYIAPGENQPYLCFLVDIQSGRVSLYNTTYDNRNHKRIPVEETGLWRGEHRFNDQGYTTYLFFSWEAYADKLPEDGDRWDFENAHWGRSGSYTWNGLKSIHGRSSWGQLAFDIPEKARLDIKRKLIFSALARYQAEKRTSHHHEGVLDHWLDEVVGDPAFYRARVQPLVDRLDAFIPRVKVDMTDDEVEHVFLEAVHGWNNIRHLVAAERRNYLAGQLAP